MGFSRTPSRPPTSSESFSKVKLSINLVHISQERPHAGHYNWSSSPARDLAKPCAALPITIGISAVAKSVAVLGSKRTPPTTARASSRTEAELIACSGPGKTMCCASDFKRNLCRCENCDGPWELIACSGPGKTMCCASDFKRNLCRCENCDGPWVRMDPTDDGKSVFESKSRAHRLLGTWQNHVLCIRLQEESLPL
ncbi:hypothetical protein BSKO_06745 [Bryopsis sp. KO-2023]|nr:hypothetical protein BSKO_06745 [Bryopsis sp. KO-2023]